VSELRLNQSVFARNVGRIIEWCYRTGYEVTLGEAWRPQWVAEEYHNQGKGIRNSLHCERLALDINLFKDGNLAGEADHKRLGEAWKQLHTSNRSGSDFKDFGHLSMSTGDGRS
jgi:hypothetical protein